MSTPEYHEWQEYSPKLVSERTYWSFDFRAEQYSATIALAWVRTHRNRSRPLVCALHTRTRFLAPTRTRTAARAAVGGRSSSAR